MRFLLHNIFLPALILTCASLTHVVKDEEGIGVESTTTYVEIHFKKLDSSLRQLQKAVEEISIKDTSSLNNAKRAFINCRNEYKTVEFFAEYFLDHTSNIFNRPVSYEIEIAGKEYQEPIGLQVIEKMLMDKNVASQKSLLLQQLDALQSVTENVNALLYNIKVDDKQILESVRLELLRINTLGVTGYDAPLMQTGLTESKQALLAIHQILQPYLSISNKTTADSIEYYIRYACSSLSGNNFTSFDRLHFYTNTQFALLRNVGKMIKELKSDLTTRQYINYETENFFSPEFLRKNEFVTWQDSTNKYEVELGKKLFFDKSLSGNKSRSCATCHQPDKYFTDGLKKNFSFSGTPIKRNTPSLLYSVYQHAQFLDGRAADLASQAATVIENISEMNGDPHNIIPYLNKSPVYLALFKKAFPKIKTSISFTTISKSIEVYESTLTPFSSAFDRFVAGNESALNGQQKLGFNLFAGKAKCATCHFIPLFNGLLPPACATTEFEIAGVPAKNNFVNPVLDKDSGQYEIVPLPYTAGSFKTPTVRNASATAPYMHNGSLPDLQRVMEFYNKGGGKGLGMKIGYQTLSEKPLQLTRKEIKAIISFINSLTDEKSVNSTVQQTRNSIVLHSKNGLRGSLTRESSK